MRRATNSVENKGRNNPNVACRASTKDPEASLSAAAKTLLNATSVKHVNSKAC
jgi:hypothetical protein